MNDERRKQIKAAADLIDQAVTILNTAKDEEQDSFDNMPESLQQGQPGQQLEENVNYLEEAVNSLEEGASTLENIP